MDKLLTVIADNPIIAMTACVAVFGVILVIILVMTMSSNNRTKKQMRLMVKALYNEQKPKVIPKFSTLDGRVRCLTFENIGGGYAKNVRIALNREWLEAKTRLADFANNNTVLAELSVCKLFISKGDSISYGLFFADNDSYEIDVFRKQSLQVTITYNDSLNQIYQESFELDLAAHEGTASATQSELIRLTQESIAKIDAIKPAIGKLEQAVAKIEPSLSGLSFGISSIEPAIRGLGAAFNNLDTKTAELVALQRESLSLAQKEPIIAHKGLTK